MSAVTPRLELRQGQSLTMTQQLQQSIKLLQMSSQELTEFIEEELEKNPLLAAEESDSETPEIATEEAKEESEEAEIKDDWGEEAIIETEQYAIGSTPATSNNNWEDGDSFESFTASEISLRDFLLEQLNLEVSDPIKRIIGQHLIDLLDESGYIKDDLVSLKDLLACPQELIEETFAILHNFEPIGICARSLQECLAIQLRDKNRLDPAMEKLLAHLDLVAKNDIITLSKICELEADDIKEMCAEIRTLNPRPASGYQHEAVEAVIPDVFLRTGLKDSWQIELNSGALPKVLVNRRYYSQVSKKTRDKQEKKYISDQLAIANWLVKALDSRANTILRVSTEIVAEQDAFFRYGIKYLRPLTLKEVAATLELHESTVSRVTTNKYLSTPRGTYELKYFFNAGLSSSSGGEGYSNKTVQHLIKELIDNEESVLSDDAIAEELKNRGIDIARRTVAKYRDILKIPSSAARKKNK